MNKKETQENL